MKKVYLVVTNIDKLIIWFNTKDFGQLGYYCQYLLDSTDRPNEFTILGVTTKKAKCIQLPEFAELFNIAKRNSFIEKLEDKSEPHFDESLFWV